MSVACMSHVLSFQGHGNLATKPQSWAVYRQSKPFEPAYVQLYQLLTFELDDEHCFTLDEGHSLRYTARLCAICVR